MCWKLRRWWPKLIIGEQCIRNDDGMLAVTDEDEKIAL